MFTFSAPKFSSDVWKDLKCYISDSNSEAAIQTHYVCQYCRPILNANKMPNRCILNGLITEPVPNELKVLDPLSKQLIQRAKAFQAIIRLGTYTGNVPSYNSLKACKGTMFFLPLPLEKTLQTLDEAGEALPDPELYIIVNGVPSKNKVVWQSIVNVEQLKVAIQKLIFCMLMWMKTVLMMYQDMSLKALVTLAVKYLKKQQKKT